MSRKPRLGLFLGDPTGIGPEITAKVAAMEDIRREAEILIIGDAGIYAMGRETAGTASTAGIVPVIESAKEADFRKNNPILLHRPGISPEHITLGRISPQAGKSVYETLTYTLELVRQGRIDGFVFAPFNKEAMRLGGSPYDSELDYFKEFFQRPEIPGEINVLDEIWTTRVTSHIPLSRVSRLITQERVFRTISFLHEALRSYGRDDPQIAVAALNPHGGEGGMFGEEEVKEIAPAVEQARSRGIRAEGPFPSDTLFLRVRDGQYRAVISMYHDQGQIATKLLGFERGVTVHGGLPIPITTPAHGTAFDIAGQGVANPEAMRRAFLVARRMAQIRLQSLESASRESGAES